MMKRVLRPHPWHGIDIYPDPKNEDILNAYIEIISSDTVKYEMDKKTGYLKVDRPQKYSNILPALYGFVPKTYCGEKLAKYTNDLLGRTDLVGDGDALDICVLTEKNITQRDLLVNARIIGGFRMLDHGEVDDKIIAVLQSDAVYSSFKDVSECPVGILDRLKHYFLTYKQIPGEDKAKCEITHLYGPEEAKKILALSVEDYNDKYTLQYLQNKLME
ncbi:inorganic pyrophosphatase [Halobacteriovorax marinus]|uniref:inorganic diphosphatase n=1 Tax=Halobacteriovorax marinus TaxID=97084 RepID=A0A1Y5F412_9BACT|nr:inorganic pyrophosphatase [Halobacteriovorax marinus]